MARPLRIDVQDGLYHVTSRGWERRAVVRDDRDRQRWLERYWGQVLKFNFRGGRLLRSRVDPKANKIRQFP